MLDSENRAHTRILVAVATLLGLVGAVPFFTATTFITDDHLLLAFSRYAPDPLVPFIRDQLGGESYRPLPMAFWWVLGRMAGASTVPFAALAFLLHFAVALEVGALVFAVRRDRRAAAIATALFFVAPATREAAYWYAASMDLLATAFGLAAILALLRGRNVVAALAFAAACWSKESSIVVPALAALVLGAGRGDLRSTAIAKRTVVVFLPVAALYLLVRTAVLHGAGGFGDVTASWAGKLLQIAAGLVHAVTAGDVLGEPAAWVVGIAAWSGLLFGTYRLARSSGRPPFCFAPLAWVVVAVLPLLAAPWIVGSRYFYLAAVGPAWLAAELLRRSSPVVAVGVIAALAGLSSVQAVTRRSDVVSYTARLSAAALETLAIVAYHQPVTRAEIEDVRGVAISKGTLDNLLEIGWVKMRGRRKTPGRPVTYGTTEAFLGHFGLNELTDLPGLQELKAAGLLDSNLPPGFDVPMPKLNDELTAEEEPLDGTEQMPLEMHLPEEGTAAEEPAPETLTSED